MEKKNEFKELRGSEKEYFWNKSEGILKQGRGRLNIFGLKR